MNKSNDNTKELLLKELEKENVQVLSLAYSYAKNMYEYGIDITQKITSAVEQRQLMGYAYNKGYKKGYEDCLERLWHEADRKRKATQISYNIDQSKSDEVSKKIVDIVENVNNPST